MNNQIEIQSIVPYLGDEIDPKRMADFSSRCELAEVPYTGCLRYTVTGRHLCEIGLPEVRIIQPLADYWSNQNIVLSVELIVENMQLIGGRIHKYKILNYPDGTVNYYELEPTLQEIKVVRRLLGYLTKEK